MSEVNIAAVIGPSHHFSGAAIDNEASKENKGQISNPRAAALQSLRKCRRLYDLGVHQLLVPPHPTPNLLAARRMAIDPFDETLDPVRLACWSSSSMWTANWATVRPSADGPDGRVHVTPANLLSNLHRALEVIPTSRRMSELLEGDTFHHHDALPSATMFADEGAANQMRLSTSIDKPGFHMFVYGRRGAMPNTRRNPPRQSFDASYAIARLHELSPHQTFFIQQRSKAIDSGVFHNDVVSTSYHNFLLCHEYAYEDQSRQLRRLKQAFHACCGAALNIHVVSQHDLPLREAVKCYLFNSEIVADASGTVWMLAENRCRHSKGAQEVIHMLLENKQSPIDKVDYVNLDESMRNGGGPACLRLRVPLTEAELAKTKGSAHVTPALCRELERIVQSQYPEVLDPKHDLTSEFADRCKDIFHEINRVLGYGDLAIGE